VLIKGCLVGVLGALTGLAVVSAGLDIGARHLATSRVESGIRAAAPGARGVHAWIHGWPFVTVAADGALEEVGARAARVVAAPVTFTDVRVDLERVHVRVGQLTSAQLDVDRIGSGTATASVSAADLGRALGVPVAVTAGGGLTGPPAAPGGAPGPVVVNVDGPGRHLVVGITGVRLVALPLPPSSLLPCVPTPTVAGGRVTLACTFRQVPAAFTVATT